MTVCTKMIGAVERSCRRMSGYGTVLLCDLYCGTCTVMWPVLLCYLYCIWPLLLCDLYGLCDMSHSVFYHHTFSLQSMHVLCMTVSRICTIISFMHSSIYLTLFNHCRFGQCFLIQEVKRWTAWAPGWIVRWDSVLDLVVVFILWGAESEASLNHQFILKIHGFLPFLFFLFSFLVCILVFFCSFLSFV
jgi:hypothetical protein